MPPTLGYDFYDGFIDIKFKVTKSTNYVLLHSKAEMDSVEELVNQKGDKVEIECIAEFKVNDYFIVKTKRNLEPSDGELTLSLFFIGFLPKLDTGIFRIEFETGINKKS